MNLIFDLLEVNGNVHVHTSREEIEKKQFRRKTIKHWHFIYMYCEFCVAIVVNLGESWVHSPLSDAVDGED